MDTALDDEETETALQVWKIPQELKKWKWKRSHNQKNQQLRTKEKKSTIKDAGAQLVAKNTQMTQSDHNERTCLPNAVTALLPS